MAVAGVEHVESERKFENVIEKGSRQKIQNGYTDIHMHGLCTYISTYKHE